MQVKIFLEWFSNQERIYYPEIDARNCWSVANILHELGFLELHSSGTGRKEDWYFTWNSVSELKNLLGR